MTSGETNDGYLTWLTILEAIAGGERDPKVLAARAHGNIKGGNPTEPVLVLPARYIVKRRDRRTHVQPSGCRRCAESDVGRRLDFPPALDRSSHESRAVAAAVEVIRLRLQLSRPRRHRHAAGDVADPQPLSRAKAQPA